MDNKKGFTLVEVLAVIIVLGIISVIIIPVINNIMEKNKEKAFIQSLNSVVRAAELYKVDSGKSDIGVIDITEDTLPVANKDIWLDGNIYEKLNTDNEKKIYLTNFTDGNFCGRGYENDYVVEKGKCKNFEVPNTCFTFSNNTITDYKEGCPKNLVIPDVIDGNKVLYIGDNAFYEKKILSVFLPETLIGIGKNAFYNSILEEVDTSKAVNLNYIDNWAFATTFLNKFDFSPLINLQKINKYAFAFTLLDGTLNLSNTKINTLGSYAFYGALLDKVDFSNIKTLTTISDNAFSDNNISSVILDGFTSLKVIEDYAFSFNKISDFDFKKIIGIEKIDKGAFDYNRISNFPIEKLVNLKFIGCGALRRNNLPEDQAIIYYINPTGTKYASSHISGYDENTIISGGSIANLVIPENVTAIANGAFFACRVKKLDLSKATNLTKIYSKAFAFTDITEVVIPKSVTYIEKEAFLKNFSSDWKKVTIEGDDVVLTTRFNSTWTNIGWPSSLKPTS